MRFSVVALLLWRAGDASGRHILGPHCTLDLFIPVYFVYQTAELGFTDFESIGFNWITQSVQSGCLGNAHADPQTDRLRRLRGFAGD